MAKYIGETTEYDKKQEVERRKVKSWLKSVSAFANGGGGCLLFGIADDDTIIGLNDAKADAEFISQKIKERIDPMPQIDLKIECVEDKELLILHVHGGEDTPYYYMGDSVLETFVRIGNESVVNVHCAKAVCSAQDGTARQKQEEASMLSTAQRLQADL